MVGAFCAVIERSHVSVKKGNRNVIKAIDSTLRRSTLGVRRSLIKEIRSATKATCATLAHSTLGGCRPAPLVIRSVIKVIGATLGHSSICVRRSTANPIKGTLLPFSNAPISVQKKKKGRNRSNQRDVCAFDLTRSSFYALRNPDRNQSNCRDAGALGLIRQSLYGHPAEKELCYRSRTRPFLYRRGKTKGVIKVIGATLARSASRVRRSTP